MLTPLQPPPRPPIILHPIALVKRCAVGHLFPVGEFTFGDGVFVGFAGGQVADAVPVGAVETHAGQALAAGEHDVAPLVVPGVVFVLLQHRELHAVDQDQLLQRQTQSHGRDHVDLYQSLTTLIPVAQRRAPRPLRT